MAEQEITDEMAAVLRSANPMNGFVTAYVGAVAADMIKLGLIWHDAANEGDYFLDARGAEWLQNNPAGEYEPTNPAADEPTLSPDAAEQTPAADGPIITPELRRAVVRLAYAEADLTAAAERVANLRTAADLDKTDPHTYAPDTRYAAAHDAQPAAAPAVDPAAAIVDLIEQYGAARASAAVAGRFSYEGSVSYRENAADLLERIRRTLADALGSRRDRERYAVLMSVGGRPVVCPCGYGVFDSCPVHDNNDSDDPAPSVEQPAAWRAPLGPQAVAALIRISNAGGRVLASTLPADIVETLVGVRWVEYVGPKTVGLMDLRLTEAGEEAAKVARQSDNARREQS